MQETKFLHTLQNRSEANKMIVHDIYIRKSTLTVVASIAHPRSSHLAKSRPAIRASSLPQCKTEQNPNWKEHNGTQNTEAGEGVLQHANPAGRTASNYYYRSGGSRLLNDGVCARVARLRRRWRNSISCGSRGARVGVRRGRLEAGLRGGDGAVVALPVVVARARRGGAVGGRPLLQQRLAVHAGRGAERRPRGGSGALASAPNLPGAALRPARGRRSSAAAAARVPPRRRRGGRGKAERPLAAGGPCPAPRRGREGGRPVTRLRPT